MPLNLEHIFGRKSKRKRGNPSIKVVSGIIGRCWISSCKNREIAQTLDVSDAIISETINNSLLDSNVIVIELDSAGKKRVNYGINFIGLIDFLIELVEDEFQGRKEDILYMIMKNRAAVGKSFLASFVLDDAYSKGLNKVKKIYETIPELLFLLILSLDATAPNNQVYLHFLRCIYKKVMLKAQEEYPELVYVWSGLTWFMMDFE